jgi:ceramide synthetase
MIYLSFFLLGLRIVKTQPWFWPSFNWWKNQTSDSRTSADFRGYYLLYVARYVAEIISVGLEYDRKDKREMLLHHFSTVFLIGISYAYGFTRVGGIIMLLLDPADVPLHVAKLFKYVADARKIELNKKRSGRSNNNRAMATQRAITVGKRCQFMADVLFGVFMVTFFITRLVMYPYVVYSSHFECRKFVNVERNLALLIGYWSCIVLLYIVLALQAYWFYLILKVAIKVVTKGEAEDVRSDDEGEDEDEDDAEDSDDENELEGKKKK